MTAKVVVLGGLVAWAGSVLLLAEVRWFARQPLAARLRPFAQPGAPTEERPGVLSLESFRDVLGPVASAIGGRLARAFGVGEELGVRLARLHSPVDVTAYRVRQLGAATAAMTLAAAEVAAAAPGPGVALLLLLGSPVLAFLLLEHKVGVESARRQERLMLELPVVAEQLAMLLSAGFSVGAALGRMAGRGQGACAEDLRRVTGRVRQGLTEAEALREWAALAAVPALDRLVAVLALNREAADLGRLLSDEARSVRRDVHRELVTTMERRAQQVWIPVTVATLVPGVIFLAIPFLEALRLFSAS